MKRRFHLSPAARGDLSDIWNYSVDHWGEAQAERYLPPIQEACERLRERLREKPLLGSGCDFVRPGYRCLPVQSHRLFYRLGDDGHVDVIRILHKAMQPRAGI
ncbi:MAG: type II toxin-antitoxin system RelE/ParE family toxin [Niveispirillum sp.]|uniref:type II toxin-antitoxin system RelE/ParE family toxin n=1 Tax=Niveispirillum sp. TaxID=1917217 RepID=UPI003BA78130